MTGYLGRMAARAAGATSWAEVAPRLPSRFEHPVASPEVSPGDHATDEAAVAGESGWEERRAVDGAVPQRLPGGPRPASVPRGSVPEVHHAVRFSAAAARPESEPALPASDHHVAAEPLAPTADAPRSDSLVEAETAPARVAVPARPAQPIAAQPIVTQPFVTQPFVTQPNAGSRPVQPRERGARQPDVVVVSVGRVEVRAAMTPAAPPAPTPQPRPAMTEGLSLHDYLRGEREVR